MDLHSVLQISELGLQTVSASAITAIPFHNAQIRSGIPHFLQKVAGEHGDVPST